MLEIQNLAAFQRTAEAWGQRVAAEARADLASAAGTVRAAAEGRSPVRSGRFRRLWVSFYSAASGLAVVKNRDKPAKAKTIERRARVLRGVRGEWLSALRSLGWR